MRGADGLRGYGRWFRILSPPLLLLLPAIAALATAYAWAGGAPGFGLDVGRVEGAGWMAEEVSMRLDLGDPQRIGLELTVKTLRLSAARETITDLHITCAQLRLDPGTIDCPKGRASLVHDGVGRRPFALAFRYRRDGPLRVSFRDLRLWRGVVDGRLRWEKARWSASLRAKRLAIGRLMGRLADDVDLKSLSGSGRLDLDVDLEGDALGVRTMGLSADSRDLGFTDPASTVVGEAVSAGLRLSGVREPGGWRLRGGLDVQGGQLYVEPVFLDAGARPLRIQASARWRDRPRALVVGELSYEQNGVVHAKASMELDLGDRFSLRSLTLDLSEARLPGAYELYAQPLLIGTTLDDLQTEGRISGGLNYVSDGPSELSLRLAGLSVEDSRGRFGIQGVSGTLRWHDAPQPLPSRLGFEAAHAYRLAFGGAELALEGGGRALRLAAPVSVPMLDGRLMVQVFELQGLGTERLSWGFDGALSPVSMEALTQALGWPPMTGKLSGMIPRVHYESGRLGVGGALLVRVFDGAITVTDLVLGDPLGPVPRLRANAVVEGLDLKALTRRFSFGKIKGRISGYVRDLQLVNWEPVRFDAGLATPKEDRSRHRISQRAVDNLSSLGGGVSGVVSGGFLRFFKEFSYGRLGLSCRLENGVCEMNGVAPAQGRGYYIVKGAGLPRIDVIGYAQRVDWTQLVGRLKGITLQARPVVE